MFSFANIGQPKTNCLFLMVFLLILSFNVDAQQGQGSVKKRTHPLSQKLFYVSNDEQRVTALRKELLMTQQKVTALQKKAEKNALIIKVLLSAGQCLFLLCFLLVMSNARKKKIETIRRKAAEKTILVLKNESAKNIKRLQRQKKVLKLQALRSQMNPHFIFNSLNAINRFLLQKDARQASDYLVRFARLIRLVLQNSRQTVIKLEDEIAFLELYLTLEKLRFDHRFNYQITIEKDLDLSIVKVPPLLIQPYLENAIWHGLTHKKESGYLNVDLSLKSKQLHCKITDNGIGRIKAAALKQEPTATYKSVGMSVTAERINLSQRIKQHRNSVIINDLILPDGNAGGTEILLTIPVHYDKSYHN